MRESATAVPIRLTVNGEVVEQTVAVRQHLVDFLRDALGLTGTHLGCEHGVCGACTVNLDGKPVRGCLVLAVQADGCDVETIEGASQRDLVQLLQREFHQRNAAQCGFCTPGMLITAADLVQQGGAPSREDIREYLSGNFCRCTGYQSIIDAVEAVCAAKARGERPRGEIPQGEAP
jgi:aerobic carbon-monoxide dehydrogenase small subunit